MSAVKSSSLRALVLTPERIPTFLIPSRSPRLFLSPRPLRNSPDRTRLLSDPEDDSPVLSPENRTGPAASPRFQLRLPPPRIKLARRAAGADTDLSTRAAMSLLHVGKVTTPYGFRAVLAGSPCTSRRESLFHRSRQTEDVAAPAPPPEPNPGHGRPRVCLRPVRALGSQVMKALSPARRTEAR